MVWRSVATRRKTGANRAKLIGWESGTRYSKPIKKLRIKKANQITHSRRRELVRDATLRERKNLATYPTNWDQTQPRRVQNISHPFSSKVVFAICGPWQQATFTWCQNKRTRFWRQTCIFLCLYKGNCKLVLSALASSDFSNLLFLHNSKVTHWL